MSYDIINMLHKSVGLRIMDIILGANYRKFRLYRNRKQLRFTQQPRFVLQVDLISLLYCGANTIFAIIMI